MIKKPLLGKKINSNHYLAKNCVGAWLMNEGAGSGLENLINQDKIINTSLQWKSNQQGICVSFAEDSSIDLGSLSNLLKTSPTRDFSIVLSLQKTNLIYNDNSNLVNSRFEIKVPNIEGSVTWDIAGVVIEAPEDFYVYDKNPSVWTFVNGTDRGMEIWQNSNLISVNRLVNPLIDILSNLYLGSKSDNYCFLYIYDKALHPEDIKSLSIDPYQFVEKTNYSLFKDKVVELGGEAEVSSFEFKEASGGAISGGIASTAYIPTPYLPTGGLNCNGDSLNLRTQIEVSSGGSVSGGLSINDIYLLTFGGVRLSGITTVNIFEIIEEVSDGEGGILNGTSDVSFNYFIDSSDGVIIAGFSPVSDFLNGRGGIVAAGTTFVFPGSTSAFGSGGIRCGGTTTVGWYIQQRIDSFGLKTDGRAINIKRGTIVNVRSGISLAMKNNNFVKDKLIKKPERIITPKESIISNSTIIDYRLEQTASWCYIEDCSDNVLPRIVEKRQGKYIPERVRSNEPRNRQIARATGI